MAAKMLVANSAVLLLLLIAPSSNAFSLQCTGVPSSVLRGASSRSVHHRPLSLPVLAPCTAKALPLALPASKQAQHQGTALSMAEDAASIDTTSSSDATLTKVCVHSRCCQFFGALTCLVIVKLSGKIGRATWLSWWVQIILSVVSTVTLFFANAVKGAGQGNIITNGIFLAGIGLVQPLLFPRTCAMRSPGLTQLVMRRHQALSFINVFWTWGYSSMGKNLAST